MRPLLCPRHKLLWQVLGPRWALGIGGGSRAPPGALACLQRQLPAPSYVLYWGHREHQLIAARVAERPAHPCRTPRCPTCPAGLGGSPRSSAGLQAVLSKPHSGPVISQETVGCGWARPPAPTSGTGELGVGRNFGDQVDSAEKKRSP